MKIKVKHTPRVDKGIMHTHDFKKYHIWFPDDDTRALLYVLQKVVTKG